MLEPSRGADSDDGNRREVAESFLSGFALQLLLLVTGILAARLLGEVGRGQQALIWIVALVGAQVAMFGLPLALTYEAARGSVTARQLLAHIAPIALLQIILVVTVYVGIMFLALSERVPATAALVTIPSLPAMVWQNYGLAVLQGSHDFRALHVFRLLPTALYVLGLAVVAIAFEASVVLVMAAWSATYVVAAIATHIYIRRTHLAWSDAKELPKRSSMARFSAAAFLGASSPLEVFRVDQLFVGILLSTVELAYYTTALAFCNLPRFLTQGLGLVAFARISAEETEHSQVRLVRRYALLGTTVALAVSVPVAVFIHPLIEITFGPDFEGAATVTQILLLATVFLCARRILSDCLRGAGLPGAGSFAEIISLVSLLPAALALVPSLGLEGFALAMVVSYVAGLTAIIVYSLRRWGRRDTKSQDLLTRSGRTPAASAERLN